MTPYERLKAKVRSWIACMISVKAHGQPMDETGRIIVAANRRLQTEGLNQPCPACQDGPPKLTVILGEPQGDIPCGDQS